MKKQPTSKMCFVCGRENKIGFQMQFFQDEDHRVYADCVPQAEHQGYPGVMHGGLVSALLDEILGRTAIANEWWCMTAQLDIRFRKPVPIGEPLKLEGEIIESRGRLLTGRGRLRLADGSLAAEARGVYMRIPEDQMKSYQGALEWWKVDD